MEKPSIVSAAEYAALQDRLRLHKHWLGNRTSYLPSEVPEEARISNDEIAAIELYDWLIHAPAKDFVYVDEEKGVITNWTGRVLGRFTVGKRWVDNFGGRRVSLFINGNNECGYSGTYFPSAGTYARIKRTTHPLIGVGRCPYCGHYGRDCYGKG